MSSERNLIILAEDEETPRGLLITAFKSLGFEVRAFDDGKPALEALEKLTSEERAKAILVTDWIMDKVDGLTLASNVRRDITDIPIMLWTSKNADEYYNTMIRSGADHALKKTYDPSRITAALAETMVNFAKRQQKQAPTESGVSVQETIQAPAQTPPPAPL